VCCAADIGDVRLDETKMFAVICGSNVIVAIAGLVSTALIEGLYDGKEVLHHN
jgi:hypothetical protein